MTTKLDHNRTMEALRGLGHYQHRSTAAALADELGVSKGTVDRWLKRQEAQGVLTSKVKTRFDVVSVRWGFGGAVSCQRRYRTYVVAGETPAGVYHVDGEFRGAPAVAGHYVVLSLGIDHQDVEWFRVDVRRGEQGLEMAMYSDRELARAVEAGRVDLDPGWVLVDGRVRRA